MLNEQTLEKSITGFANYARNEGLSIAVSEVLDAVRAISAINPDNVQIFKNTLAYCVIKDINDASRYDEIFSQYFLKDYNSEIMVKSALMSAKINKEKEGCGEGGEQAQDRGENEEERDSQGKGTGNKWQDTIKELDTIHKSFRLFIAGDIEKSGVSLLKDPLKVEDRNNILDTLLKEAIKGMIKPTDQKEILDSLKKFSELAKTIDKMSVTRHRIEPVFGINAVTSRHLDSDILDKLIDTESEEDRQAMRQTLELIAEQIHVRLSKQLGINQRQKILNYKETIKMSIKTFGEPFELIKCAKKQKVRKLVTICDISGSVKHATELIFSFMYELHQVFNGKAQHHIFVSDTHNVTNHFERSTFTDCFNGLMTDPEIYYRGYSDYNMAFSSFSDEYMRYIDQDTIVIIVGDARNNRNDPGLKYLRSVRDKAHTVLWLNPEHKSKWNTGDSIVQKYETVLNHMIDISTLRKLLDFLSKLPNLIVIK